MPTELKIPGAENKAVEKVRKDTKSAQKRTSSREWREMVGEIIGNSQSLVRGKSKKPS